jgi:hypothetical protein
VPLRAFFFLATALVGPFHGCCNRKVCDGSAVRCVADFRIASQIADQNNFVDSGHGVGTSLLSCRLLHLGSDTESRP